MLESLVEGGWNYLQLEGHCLYDHSPSPQVQPCMTDMQHT